jgi:CubicO group peptidase (beta-lactamase class C family)
MFPSAEFPSVAAAIQEGISRGLHTGVQIYVSLNSQPILDSALGDASPGVPMSPATVMPWRSAGKPLTALLILRQIENQCFQLSTRLSELLPETVQSDKHDVTIFDLLTHQSGFPATETGWPHADWSTTIETIVSTARQLPIGTAAYHPQSSWFLLGEILRRTIASTHLATFDDILTHELLEPLGLNSTSCGIKTQTLAQIAGLIPTLYERDKGQLAVSNYGTSPWLTQPSPGGNLRGPIRELGVFLELLLRNGKLPDGTPFVSSSTVQQMMMRHRVNQFDQTLQHVVDFGLGVICNSNRHGLETVPYGFGRYASESAFGHGGSQCSMGFCDPQHGLVVAWSANGFCGEGQHQRRNRLINEAIYKDLALIP